MNYFCTYCDQGYAARMLCLLASLKEQGEPFRLHVLCFDAETEAVIAAQGDESLVSLSLAELLAADPEYAATRLNRSRVEFYFTSTPVLVRHCLLREPAAEMMIYLDADLFFFAPASQVLAEQGDASVGIVPHRFTARSCRSLINGIYNVGWVSFRRDKNGMSCLEWWRERCIEWCYDRVEDGRFADQGYLNDFPVKFAGVKSLEHPGVNAAPWNVEPSKLETVCGRPWMHGKPVLFYHYQGIRELKAGWFDPGLRSYHLSPTRVVREALYLPYLRRLVAAQAGLRKHGIAPSIGFKRTPTGGSVRDRWERLRMHRLWTLIRRWRGKLVYCPEPGLVVS